MSLYLGGKKVGTNNTIVKEVPKEKFGASVDTFLGDVDANGVLTAPTWSGGVNFAGVTEIGVNGLDSAFYGRKNIYTVDLSTVKKVSSSGLYFCFRKCTNLISVDMSSLESVGSGGLNYAFQECSKLKTVNLRSLQKVGTSGLNSAFRSCPALSSVDFSSLEVVSSSSFPYAFYDCSSLTTISFPSLTSVQANSFGSTAGNSMFYGCFGLTEIHFRADMQATIEAMSQYANKWGATNATIYFDL